MKPEVGSVSQDEAILMQQEVNRGRQEWRDGEWLTQVCFHIAGGKFEKTESKRLERNKPG